ncbi:MAG: hypothetical protein VW644_14640, partial [Alphaproteobacteria bacterium]
MTATRATLLAFASALFLIIGTLASANANDDMAKFFGSYVGSGMAERLDKGTKEQRDLDVTIERYKDKGFTVKWITVMRGADGERTGEGVKRRAIEENFIPYADRKGVFIDAPSGGLFSKAELPNPLKGEPMRWAAIDGDTLSVYSMAISDSGASELQVYH